MPTKSKVQPNKNPLLRAQKGSNLTFTVIQFVIVIGFLGLATFSGLSTFLQDELNKTVSTAAMVGASSFYDGDTDLAPVFDPDSARAAATATFQRNLQWSRALQRFNATLTGINLDVGAETVTVTAQMNLPTPFLSLLGINTIALESAGTAQYVKQVPGGFPVTMYKAATPATLAEVTGGLGGGLPVGGGGGLACATTPGANPAVSRELIIPVTNRRGPDAYIESTDGHGYVALACTDNECWDVGYAARLVGNGMVRDSDFGAGGGTVNRIIYGTVYIDLGATGSDYSANVNKATYIRLLDDGVPDRFLNGSREIELCPQSVVINRVETYHVGNNCVFGQAVCPVPAGFETF